MTYAPEEIMENSERLKEKSKQLRKEFEIFLQEVLKRFDEFEEKFKKNSTLSEDAS